MGPLRRIQGEGLARKHLPGPKQPSIVWIAAAILVQHPELGAKITDRQLLDDLDRPGMDLFRAVADLVLGNPAITTALLVEHFRDSEHQHTIGRLASWAHPVLSQDVAAEFVGVLNQMRRAAIKGKVEHLLQKQKIYGLTPAEIAELGSLTRLQATTAEVLH